MNRFATRLLLLLALAAPANAAPRLAVARITDIYRQLTSTANLQKDLQHDRDEIGKDERIDYLRKLVAELQGMQSQLQQKKGTDIDEATKNMARDYEMKRQEAQTLKDDFDAFQKEKNRLLNVKMVTSMRGSLDNITKVARAIAKQQGFDALLDSSGNSNTTVPILVYSKSEKDLTDDIIAALKDAGDPPAPPVDPAALAAPVDPTGAPTAPVDPSTTPPVAAPPVAAPATPKP